MYFTRFARAVAGAAVLAGAAACSAPDLVAPTDAARPSAGPAPLAAVGTAAADGQLLQSAAAPGLCVAVSGGQAVRYARAVLAACADVPAQRWGITAAPAAGAAPVFDGALCLDNWSARMRAGDSVGTWNCVPGAPSQQWSLTASGELRLSNGLCAGLAGGAAAGTPLTLQTCNGANSQKWAGVAAGAPRQLATTENPSLCVAVSGGQAVRYARAVLAACADVPAQKWGVAPAPGAALATVFDGALCLDDWGARARAGDSLGTWNCIPGASTQQWTLTAAGEVRLSNGLCAGLAGAAAAGTPLTLQSCNGANSQKWTSPSAAPSPAPSPPPAPPSAAPSGADAVFAFLGRAPSVASQIARGGAWARYETDFTNWAEQHWTWEGADNYNANFYDRAMIYYVWWARTGNATYLSRANQLALNHRAYMEGTGFRPQPYLLMIDGVAMHAILNNDERSAAAVRAVAEEYTRPGTYWATVVGDSTEPDLDARSQARVLSAALDAWYITPAGAARDAWAGRLRALLPRLLAAQGADGAYRFRNQCGFNKPFMSGMQNEAFIRYYTTFEQDQRIVGSVKRAVDYMWANDWVPGSSAFRYIGGYCNGDVPDATADLNNLIVTGFGFVAQRTGDASYFTKGDAVFTGAVNGAWLTGTKQFNQQYTASYRYLGMRF